MLQIAVQCGYLLGPVHLCTALPHTYGLCNQARSDRLEIPVVPLQVSYYCDGGIFQERGGDQGACRVSRLLHTFAQLANRAVVSLCFSIPLQAARVSSDNTQHKPWNHDMNIYVLVRFCL